MPREQKTKQNMQSFSKQPGLRNKTQRRPTTQGSWCWNSPSWCQQWHQLQLRNCPAFLMAHGAMTQSGKHVARDISASWSDESDVIYSMPKATISSEHLYVFPFPFYISLSNSDQVQVKQIQSYKTAHTLISPPFLSNCLSCSIRYREGRAASRYCFLCAGVCYLFYCHWNHTFHSTLSKHIAWKMIGNNQGNAVSSLPHKTMWWSVTIALAILLISYVPFSHLFYSFFVGCKLFDMGTKTMWEFTNC